MHQPTTLLTLRLPRTLAACLLALAGFVATLFAQSGSASISGRVFDEATGRSLRGAVVRAAGTNAVDYTTEDGRFLLVLPAGTITLEVDYVGLDPHSQAVTVPAGGAASLNIGLRSEGLMLEPVVVRESARGQALAINQQKTAAGLVNIVSEEVFGNMVDGNIGYALQRLPGLTVDEGQDGAATSINIRGIAGEYNSFQVDGNRAPTSGGSRSFNPTQFSADGITNIEVIKAPTPDRDGDAIGGIVNVITRTAFQRDSREVKLKVSGVYSDLPEKWDHAASLGFSDIFSVGGGEKNLGLSATLSSHRTNRFSLNRDMDWVRVTPANNPTLNLGQFDPPVWFMESSHWEHDTRVTNTRTISGSIDFRTDAFNSFYFRPLYSSFDRKGIKFESDIDIDTRFQDAVGGRKTYAALTPNSGRGTPGSSGSRGSRGWIGTDEDAENSIHSFSFGGRHERPQSLLTYDFFYSRSRLEVLNDTELNMLMEPTSPWMVFEYIMYKPSEGLVDINVINGVDSTDLGLMSEGELAEGTSVKTEEVFSARADWERKFSHDRGEFAVKLGAKYRLSQPRFDQTVLVHTMDDAFPYAQVVEPTDAVIMRGPKYYDVYPRRGQELRRTSPGLFELAEEDTLEDSNFEDYDAEEETSAAYVMGTWRSGRHTIIGGVRFERNDWSNVNKRVSYLDGNATVTPVSQGDSYDFFLPGLHLRHEVHPNLILRESYNRSYGRPRLGELTSGRFVNEDGDITDGNPNLQPATSDNFDVQLEYYTANGGLYSAGFFYKDVKNFTYEQVYDFDVLDANGIPVPDPDGGLEYERPVNGSSAVNYGWELIARQRLAFLPGPLKGLSAAVSATFTESEAEYPNRTDDRKLPVPGFSKYLFTGSLEWAWADFRIRADYRYRDDFIEGLGDDIESDEFFGAEERVDLELSYRLRRGLTLFATGTNLTDRPQVSYTGYAQFVEDTSFPGRKISVGLEYSF